MKFDRRRLLGAGALGFLSTAIPGAQGGVHREGGTGRAKQARNVIFMVADGMSLGTLTLADMCHRHRHDAPLHWVELMGEAGVRRSTAFTNSADSHVTDSAAGSTAWGIGEKVNNKSIGITPDGRSPTPVLVHAAQQGKATGLVTTTTVTHATPAGFIANVPNRDMEKAIAEQMIERGFDVALGGGRGFFSPELLRKRPDLTVVGDAASLRASADKPGPLLGLFHKSHMSYEIDRPETEPDLAEMTRTALTRLFKAPNGFVLQVEGGRVDHAAHTNDAAALIRDMHAFDRAIRVVREMTKDRDDTLVIITSDHGNANPALTKSSAATYMGVYLLGAAKHSFEWLFQQANPAAASDDGVPFFQQALEGKGVDPKIAGKAKRLIELIKDNLLIELDADQSATFAMALAGKRVDPFLERCTATSVLGSLLANKNCVAFLSANHTSDMVEVTSWGPGSETIRPVIQNTDLHGVMVASLDLAPARPLA